MSTFKKLLVPVDGSPPSDAAVQLATRLAREHEAQVLFLHVCEVAKIIAMTAAPTMGPGIDPSYAINAEVENGKIALAEAVEAAIESGIQAQALTLEGGCVDSILDTARRNGVDLIVIGSHGRGGIARAVMGSVAEGVLRRADVPVLVTRAHVHAARQTENPGYMAATQELVGTPHEVDPVC